MPVTSNRCIQVDKQLCLVHAYKLMPLSSVVFCLVTGVHTFDCRLGYKLNIKQLVITEK